VIVHVVLVKPRPDLSSAERAELEETIPRLGSVPGVRDITWGPDFSGRSKGYAYGAVLSFDSRQDLDAYGTDPTHLQIVQIFERLTLERLVVDYETGTSVSST
jgi:hypothetical protein